MLPLPPFEWLAPTTVAEAVAALAEDPTGSRVVAGGTDVLPNLKHGLGQPRRLIGLGRIDELARVERRGAGALWIGAGVTLDRVASDPDVAARYPALATAAGAAASPQLRRMGTLGGNLCLDTRCGYYNQTAFWRGALGHCLKTTGDTCHVVPTGRRCVAALAADTPAPLAVYDAEIELRSARGSRRLPIADFYVGDGVHNQAREPDELVLGVHLPPPEPGLASAYQKLRARAAIDFPLLSVAVAIGATAVRVVVGALGPRLRVVRLRDGGPTDRPLGPTHRAAIAAAAAAQCHPLANLGAEAWRAELVAPIVERALAAAAASAGGA